MRILLSMFLMAVVSPAQTVTASLVGHVADASGAAVAGVKIVATEATRNVSRDTVTNDAGNYTLNSVEPGTLPDRHRASRLQAVRQGRGQRSPSTAPCAWTRCCEVGEVTETVEVSPTR